MNSSVGPPRVDEQRESRRVRPSFAKATEGQGRYPDKIINKFK